MTTIIMTPYVGSKLINAMPMNRADYNQFRGWELPSNENGADDGFLIEYIDGGEANTPELEGYVSWSPKDVFENAYRPNGQLSFGDAVLLMKEGLKLARAGWNGDGMWVIYNPGSNGNEWVMASGDVYSRHGLDKVEILPHFDMYTSNADGRRAMLPGWLASQSDIDAEDWSAVE